MMDINVNDPREVYLTGMAVLSDALGPVGFARFMQQISGGQGDYTKEKYQMPEMSLGEIMARIEKIQEDYTKYKATQISNA